MMNLTIEISEYDETDDFDDDQTIARLIWPGCCPITND